MKFTQLTKLNFLNCYAHVHRHLHQILATSGLPFDANYQKAVKNLQASHIWKENKQLRYWLNTFDILKNILAVLFYIVYTDTILF